MAAVLSMIDSPRILVFRPGMGISWGMDSVDGLAMEGRFDKTDQVGRLMRDD